jgi:hypothetical protein
VSTASGGPAPTSHAGALIVYADFSDPFCHLASRRVDVLRAAGVEVDWRAVQTAPRRPVTGARDAARLTQLSRRSDELAGLLVAAEELSSARPGFVPNTEAAVAAYAEAYGAGVADEVRRLLFALYWEHGVDIGNPNELRAPLAPVILSGSSSSDPPRQFGYAVSVSRGPITTAAWRRIRSWRGEWRQLGEADVPVVCRGAGPAFERCRRVAVPCKGDGPHRRIARREAPARGHGTSRPAATGRLGVTGRRQVGPLPLGH